jgi:hypothetical protein
LSDEQWFDHEANTVDEQCIIDEPQTTKEDLRRSTIDCEIYQAVMDAIKARENIEINSGDDVDDILPLEPHPTCRNVPKAVSTIGRCIDDLNEPIARKIWKQYWDLSTGNFTSMKPRP